MRAIRLHETGGPDVLRLDEIPTPEPGPGQILIKAHSIGTGIPDQLVRTGRYPWMPALPTIPGIEISGTVAALGSEVTELKEGDRVFGSAIQNRSCYAEYVALDHEWVFPLADGINLSDAGCLQNYRVAWCILHEAVRLREGDTAAIVGASGAVGNALLQLAHAAGAKTIALTRAETKAAFIADQGADHIINTGRDHLSDRIKDITDGQGVDLFIDPVAGLAFKDHLDLLAPLGTLVLYGMIEDLPTNGVFEAQCARWGRSPAVRLFSIHAYDDQPAAAAEQLAKLMGLMKSKKIEPAIHAELPLELAGEAHRLIDSASVMGKILLQPDRTEASWRSGVDSRDHTD